MRLWLIPMMYVIGSVVLGIAIPRLEQAFLPDLTLNISVASAQAYLSAVASGMMALMSIVFAMAFVLVQFNAIAYSPRLVVWIAHDHSLFHSLGIFAATFIYALVTVLWVDRGGSGTVPLISAAIVAVLLIFSMLLFSRLVQRLSDLQITNILSMVGAKGRSIVEEMFPLLDEPETGPSAVTERRSARLGPPNQELNYAGVPSSVARFEIRKLLGLMEEAGGVAVISCAVGDTIADGTLLLTIHGAHRQVPEAALMETILLARERTFDQDPKYPIRLLVDIAIKALSPAINDPTTAVQTIDQIEDLLRRLGRRKLDTGRVHDGSGTLRIVFPTPSWDDYLSLSFDEIRQYGSDSVQVMRRLRATLMGLISSLKDASRIEAAEKYLKHLDQAIGNSSLDSADRAMAQQEDRQGLGVTRHET
jgi:uncharacterized membrane protein